MVGPTATLTPLARTDGSASYQCPATGFNILSSVNAPVELPGRRDALKPEDATVEVLVKPGTAPNGVGEQYAKEIIKNLLGKLVLGRERGFPRRGVVVTLAVIGGESVARGDSYLTMLPALLHASLLALLSAAVPLSMTFSATVLAVTKSGDIISEPSVQTAKAAASLHALAFSSKGHLLLNESQGAFDFDTWEQVHERALTLCRGQAGSDEDVSMAENGDGQPLEGFIRETVEDKVHNDYAWKIDED
ncbi:putative exosome complex subunit Rrp46 [Aspergillus glaucus CBS 516.65]|uniref:Uncharacterized protein n=1 Tax=Aspergillus glaucus CBS 516.65 TaxID=1160497 RepID=A0A1L9V4I6_ASPGL|nr:hypothetical protein ASPGLDRAFT_30342 [Aspergillus glaucus CBS 516.65]OJJ78845.1 hypothetical protein ASPGLDRAFT_30342 [Aspergillus glaucus CBS 516.65]